MPIIHVQSITRSCCHLSSSTSGKDEELKPVSRWLYSHWLLNHTRATIKTLHHALLAEYESAYRPIDVLLVSELNDISWGRTVDQGISDIESLVSAVMDLCGALNAIGISTLPFPPAVLPSDKRRIQGDKFEELSYINDQIMNLNKTLKLPSFPSAFVPKFHT